MEHRYVTTVIQYECNLRNSSRVWMEAPLGEFPTEISIPIVGRFCVPPSPRGAPGMPGQD